MEKRKLTKADLDKVRDIEGFPIGTDEDIIALSDAPYYTACPNPFIKEFIEENGTPYDEETDDYHCEPFASDLSEGKSDAIYTAHSYHTKVPYKAIMKYILYYTNPGDFVLDGFCGTGMTGVAAQMCGCLNESEKYEIRHNIPQAQFGKRYAIISDLSPAASYIAYNYAAPVDIDSFRNKAEKAVQECEKEYGWMFETLHTCDESQRQLFTGGQKHGRIDYVVWSDVFVCPHCGEEFVFWDVAVDPVKNKIVSSFVCPHCGVKLTKKDCKCAMDVYNDTALNQIVSIKKQVPVKIQYTYAGKRYEKKPDQNDLDILKRIDALEIPYWFPTDRMCEGKESRRNDKAGIKYVHQFYQKRTLAILAKFCSYCDDPHMKWLITAVSEGSSKLNRERPGGLPSKLTGTLYISSLIREIDVISFIERKIKKYIDIQYKKGCCLISTNSATSLSVPDSSIDYIFTDPPFGDNLNYSELSFIWEAWLKVKTDNRKEAIINSAQNKGLVEYQQLMTECFKSYYRVLKPNRWMTVEFHNSKNAVWNAIQESLQHAGFIVADVRTLDKRQGSFKQVNSTTAVKQDLIISAYKPKEQFIREFNEKAGTEETAWSFVRQHLSNLPVIVDADHDGKIDIISERQAYLLFDRMVAYHIMNGIPVPIDATDFYKGLDEKFLKRDGMYFLPDQVNEYDTARIKMDVEPIQFELFVTNEKSAIAWLYQQLDTPQTYAELQPKFMQEVKSVDRHEDMPELSVMLDENFIQDDKGRWYIPDRTKEGDVAKLREKNLWKEFESYMNSKGKLKLFRSEAIRVGFSRLWKDKNYHAIVDMAERLPEQTIQEDDKLLMYYDISLSRVQ